MLLIHIGSAGAVLGTLELPDKPSKVVKSLVGFNTTIKYTSHCGLKYDMDCIGFKVIGNKLHIEYGDTQPVIFTVKPAIMTPANKNCAIHFAFRIPGCNMCDSDEVKTPIQPGILSTDDYRKAYQAGCGCQPNGKFKDGCVNCFSTAQYGLAKIIREKQKKLEDVKPLPISLNESCEYCLGYGLWDDGTPMSHADALEGYDSEACPKCHSSSMGGEEIVVTIDEGKPRTSFNVTEFSSLFSGDDICVESLDMSAQKTQ
jgi:hypothetical protein